MRTLAARERRRLRPERAGELISNGQYKDLLPLYLLGLGLEHA